MDPNRRGYNHPVRLFLVQMHVGQMRIRMIEKSGVKISFLCRQILKI